MKKSTAIYAKKAYKVFEINNELVGYHRVILVPCYYSNNNNLAIQAISINKDNVPTEPFGTLTVNLTPLPDGYAYIKNYSENTGWAEDLAKQIGKNTGNKRQSGYVEIPLYKIDVNKVYAKI